MSQALDQLIADRRGVVLRSELYALGMKPRDLHRQVCAGLWKPSGRFVLVHHRAAPGLRTATLVAARRNPGAALTGTSAALLRPHPAWSTLDLDATPAMIILPRQRRGPWKPVQHRGAVIDSVDGLRVADTHTALVDLMRFLDWPQAAAVAGAANRSPGISHEMLSDSVRRLAHHGGARQLRVLVRAMSRGAESGPEIDLHLALQRARIQGWVANASIVIGDRQYRPDIAFLRPRVAIEYDGLAIHATEEAFFRDRQRDADFQFADWLVLRLTRRTLYDESLSTAFMADLRRCLTARRVS